MAGGLLLIAAFSIFWGGFTKLMTNESATLLEGIKKTLKDVWDALFPGAPQQPPESFCSVAEGYFKDLTEKLAHHYSNVFFESAFESSERLIVNYDAYECDVSIEVIERIFEQFIRNLLNLNQKYDKVAVFAIQRGDKLTLMYGWTPAASQQIQAQLENRRSRQLPKNNADLTE